MALDAMVEVVLSAPGRTASVRALAILRQLATAGDFAAVRALVQVVASEIGGDATAVGLLASASIAELAEAADVEPLCRLYALGFMPRLLLEDLPRWAALAKSAGARDDFHHLQRLIRRSAPTQHEVLKAHLLCAFTAMYGTQLLTSSAPSSNGVLAVVDQIGSNARVVPGDAVDSGFEFGREIILSAPTKSAFLFIVNHELGHHVVEDALQHHPASTIQPDEVRDDLTTVLPALVEAARARQAAPLEPGDSRGWRSESGLSVLCTQQQCTRGVYTHVSLTDGAGPLRTDIAVPIVCALAALCGAGPERVAAVESARGVFHLGIEGDIQPDEIRRRAALDISETNTAAPQAWFAELHRQCRIGMTEADIPLILGVEERLPIAYGPDAEAAWRERNVCERVRSSTDLGEVPAGALAELLQIGVQCGDESTVQRVLAIGARPDAGDRCEVDLGVLGASSLVVREGLQTTYLGPSADELLTVLAQLGAHGVSLDGSVTDDGETLLTDAAARRPDLVHRLLVSGAKPDVPNRLGEMAVAIAAASTGASVVELLLDAGASVALADKQGRTPLHRAAARGDGATVSLLLGRGAPVDARAADRSTPLLVAMSAAAACALCEAGADVDATDTGGTTPLMHAAAVDGTDVLKELLSRGADVEAATDRGLTALHNASIVAGGDGESIGLLVGAGANLDDETNDGLTPLMGAAMCANAFAVRRLVELGADVNVRSASGSTALLLASDGRTEFTRDFGRTDAMEACVRVLVNAGATISSANDAGDTPLHWATLGFDAGLVRVLLELGADPNARNGAGNTPLDIARASAHQAMIEDLLAAGAIVEPEAGTS